MRWALVLTLMQRFHGNCSAVCMDALVFMMQNNQQTPSLELEQIAKASHAVHPFMHHSDPFHWAAGGLGTCAHPGVVLCGKQDLSHCRSLPAKPHDNAWVGLKQDKKGEWKVVLLIFSCLMTLRLTRAPCPCTASWPYIVLWQTDVNYVSGKFLNLVQHVVVGGLKSTH